MMYFKPFILTVLAVGVVSTRAKTDFEVQEDFAANDGFINVSGYMLKIVSQEKVPYDTAVSACAEVGQLVRIDTPDKQLAIRSFLQSSGIRTITYWIQGRNVTDGIWRFDDGTPTPMSQTYWAPGEPGDRECGNLWGWVNFQWDDTYCSDSNGYICERTGFH